MGFFNRIKTACSEFKEGFNEGCSKNHKEVRITSSDIIKALDSGMEVNLFQCTSKEEFFAFIGADAYKISKEVFDTAINENDVFFDGLWDVSSLNGCFLRYYLA